MDIQEKEGRGCSLGDSMIVCQPLSVQTSTADSKHEQPAESGQGIADDKPEPMRISLDFTNSDNGDDKMSTEEELTSNLDSLAITGSGQAATSSQL